eukprot:1911754-Alexandrium_andersonii.AAC.1
MGFRLLSILSAVYRLWGRVRLGQLDGWSKGWDRPNIYAGVDGKSAEMAWFGLGLEAEYALLSDVQIDVTVVDLYRAFDTIPRKALYPLLLLSGLPLPLSEPTAPSTRVCGLSTRLWGRWGSLIPGG